MVQMERPIVSSVSRGDSALVEEVKKQRFSALVDGIFMGVGIVFILLGVLMPISSDGLLVQGLLSIIGGLLVLSIGTVVEVYHCAKLNA